METTSHSPPPKLEQIVQKFQTIKEPKRRYEYLLSFAKRVPPLRDVDKTSTNRVPGCVAQVYLTASLQEGNIFYCADADAQIPKGLVGFLIEGLNGVTPEEVIHLPPDFIKETGLNMSLTPSRSNGFYNIFQSMKQRAIILC
jgi:cysteine desulfuration protein SufE